MVKIKNDGGMTIVRRVRKDGGAKGTLAKDNLEEAIGRGHGNVVMSRKTK